MSTTTETKATTVQQCQRCHNHKAEDRMRGLALCGLCWLIATVRSAR